MAAFLPRSGSTTINIAAGIASANTPLDSIATVNVAGRCVRVFNSGTVPVFINFGPAGTTAAVASSMPIAPGATEVFTIPMYTSATSTGGTTSVAAITASGTATIYFTLGDGE